MAEWASGDESIGGGAFALHCRGDVRLYCGGADCTPKSRKGRALLAVLAAEQRPLTRVKIIDLLWSDRQEEQARASLRTLLADLKEQFNSQFEELLAVDRERVALGPAVRTDLADPTLARPSGELFEGLDHIDPELDEWLRLERERWASREPCALTPMPPNAEWKPGRARLGLPVLLVLGAVAAVVVNRPDSIGSQNAQVKRAQSLLRDGIPSEALRARAILLEVVREEPNNAIALGALAEATMAASDHPNIGGTIPLAHARREARSYANRAIKLEPDVAIGWAALGASDHGTSKAVPALEKAVALDPNNGSYRTQLGRALEYQNRYDEAYLHQRRAVELDPQSPRAMIGLLRAAVQLNRRAEMDVEIKAFERRARNRNDVALVKGYLAFLSDDFPQCTNHFWPLVESGDPRPASLLMNCLVAIGETRRALHVASRFPSLQSDVLRADVGAVAERARKTGQDFWLRNFESLAAADLLVRSGNARLLVESFDASYSTLEEFERQGGRVAMEPTSLLIAMQQMGREDDVRQIKGILARQARSQGEGMAENAWSIYAKAVYSLADDQPERTVALLEQCFPDCFYYPLRLDISQTAYFARLNGNPRFDALVLRFRQRINAQRKAAGLAPLESLNAAVQQHS